RIVLELGQPCFASEDSFFAVSFTTESRVQFSYLTFSYPIDHDIDRTPYDQRMCCWSRLKGRKIKGRKIKIPEMW
ncbi:MAG: hypothetical protein WBD20_27955, partial [Pirellulaceae bacterium]